MRRFQRETAAAFGDEPDRDVEAEFGALTVKASVAAPKLKVVATPKHANAFASGGTGSQNTPKVVAPKLAAPKPAVAVKAPTVKVAVATPKASAKVVTTAKPTSSAPAPAKPSVATTAQQGNFLDGGAPLAAPTVKVPAGTVVMTQAQRDANARALLNEKSRELAIRNAPYQAQVYLERKHQAEEHARLMADPGPDGQNYRARQKFISSAGVDVGQIVMGAKVIAIGATVIASGGAVAGAVGLTTGGAALASAAAADRLVAAVEKGGELGAKAKGVINDVKAAAAKGDKVAKEALGAIESVAKERISAAVPAGVEQALTGAAKDAVNAVAGVASSLSGSGSLNLGALSASLSAAAGASSSGYSSALLSAGNRPAVASTRPPASQLSQFDLGPQQPRWLVTPEGRVVDLNRTPAKATARGYMVTTAGKVVKQ